jgi:hypothetical protein
MDKWDEEKLRSVILSKHGNPRTTTEVQGPPLILAFHLTYFPILRFLLDRMQVFYRSCRVTKVRERGPPLRSSLRRSIRESDFSHFSRFTFFQVWMVLAMSQRGVVSIPTRSPTRVCTQVSKEGDGGGREGEHDQPRRVLRSRGASSLHIIILYKITYNYDHHMRSDTNSDRI